MEMKTILSLTLALTLAFSPLLFSQKVVLYENFEAGIPDDWTNSPVSSGTPDSTQLAVWKWTTNEGLPGSNFWLDFYHLRSPTAQNGFLIFDAAILDAGPNSYTDNAGPVQSPFVSDVISPVIDCSDLQTVALSFHQELYSNPASTSIGVSKDGGLTWEFLPINEDVSGFAGGTKDYNSVQTINLTKYGAGEPSFRFCFRYDGDYYYWLIDDVKLSELPEHDLAITNVRYPLTSYAQPASQINGDTLKFGMSVSNLGRTDETEVIMKYSVLDTSGQIYFADSVSKTSFLSVIKDLPFEFSTVYVPEDLMPGQYMVRYEVYVAGEKDFTPVSNVAELPFEVTEGLFSKSYGDYYGSVDWGAGDGSFKMGNLYTTALNSSETLVATKAIMAVDRESSTNLVDIVPVKLYEVKPEVGPDWSGFDINSDNSLILRGVGDYLFGDEPFFEKVEVALLNAETLEEGVVLNPGRRYILVAEFLGDNASLGMQMNNKISYEPESTIAWGSGFNQWLIGSAGGFPTSDFGFVPIMDMVVETQQATNTERTPLPSSSMTLAPNPASDHLFIDFNFEKPTDFVLSVINAQGQVVQRSAYKSGLRERVEMDVNGWTPGVYFLRLVSRDGQLVKKVVVEN
jgi:hypothetical protein